MTYPMHDDGCECGDCGFWLDVPALTGSWVGQTVDELAEALDDLSWDSVEA